MKASELGRPMKCTNPQCDGKHSLKQMLAASALRDDKILRCPTCGTRRGNVT